MSLFPFSPSRGLWILVAAVWVLGACATSTTPPEGTPPETPAPEQRAVPETATPGQPPPDSSASARGLDATADVVDLGVPKVNPVLVEDDTPPPFSTDAWQTDFSRRSVPWEEIISGGVPKDGIPAIDAPQFESVQAAGEWLEDPDPLILFEHGDIVRAYPLAILIWHEIVNDQVGDLPIAVTFCPLCNASIVFDRRLDDMVLDFGTTGNLRHSDLIMYDRQTESWWQQLTGEAIVGTLTGRQLRFLPSQVIPWKDFRTRFPDGQVLARPQRNGRFLRSYGRNPYIGYDSSSQPFLFLGKPDPRLPATERVLGLTTETRARAYPFSLLAQTRVLHDEFDGIPLVIFHISGMASALDTARISTGKDIGSVAVYDRRLGDQELTFRPDGQEHFVDEQTGTRWNILGEAVAGPLQGSQLTPILHFDHFWFAWAAFFPDTELYR